MSNALETGHWSDANLDNFYEYPAGFAGSAFFSALKEKGTIVCSKCKKCGRTTLPARAFCSDADCFSGEVDWIDVGIEGTIDTFTRSHIDLDESDLGEPIQWGLVKFPGVDHGGLLHRITGTVAFGSKVKAKLRPAEDRIGSVLDIICFEVV